MKLRNYHNAMDKPTYEKKLAVDDEKQQRTNTAIRLEREKSLSILAQVVFKELYSKEGFTWDKLIKTTVDLYKAIQKVQFLMERDIDTIKVEVAREEEPFV